MGFNYNESLNAHLVETQSKCIKRRTVTLRGGILYPKGYQVLSGSFHGGSTHFKLKTYDLQNIDKEVLEKSFQRSVHTGIYLASFFSYKFNISLQQNSL